MPISATSPPPARSTAAIRSSTSGGSMTDTPGRPRSGASGRMHSVSTTRWGTSPSGSGIGSRSTSAPSGPEPGRGFPSTPGPCAACSAGATRTLSPRWCASPLGRTPTRRRRRRARGCGRRASSFADRLGTNLPFSGIDEREGAGHGLPGPLPRSMNRALRGRTAMGWTQRAWGALLAGVVAAHPPAAAAVDHAKAVAEVHTLYETDRLPEAEVAAKRLLATIQHDLAPDAPEAIEVSGLLVRVLMSIGKKRLPEAVLLAEDAARAAERAYARGDPRLGTALNNLGDVYVYFGSFAEAKDAYQRELESCRAATDRDKTCLGRSLDALGSTAQQLGDYAEARLYLEEALAILEMETTPDGRAHYGGTLYALADVYLKEGDFEAALDAAKRSVQVCEEPNAAAPGFRCEAVS